MIVELLALQEFGAVTDAVAGGSILRQDDRQFRSPLGARLRLSTCVRRHRQRHGRARFEELSPCTVSRTAHSLFLLDPLSPHSRRSYPPREPPIPSVSMKTR